MQILILAAGLGTRLRPLTDQMPKPLVPVVDASILEHQVRFAKTLGNVELHANAHHLASQLETAGAKLGFKKVWVEYPEILGTGGPIHRIATEGGADELLILNGDCYCNFDLNAFVNAARNSGAEFALLARDFNKVNTLQVRNGKLCGIANRFTFAENFGSDAADETATFSGISWYSKKALQEIRAEERDVRDFWKRMIQAGRGPFICINRDANATWIDMGTPEGLRNAVNARLAELKVENWIDASVQKNFVAANGTVVNAGAVVGENAKLDNVILLPGAVVNAWETLRNEIRGKDFSWRL